MSNLQQHEDRITALEVEVGLRKKPAPPETEVQRLESDLAAAIKRAQEKAGK
jgi:hypothetical protein